MGTAGILWGLSLQGNGAVIGQPRDTWLGTAGILTGWAMQGSSAVGHCRDNYSAAGHCRDILWLGIAVMLCGWALQGSSAVVGTAGIFGGWALQ